jgi:hypothetical protein
VRHPHKPRCTGIVNSLPCEHDAAGFPRCYDYGEVQRLVDATVHHAKKVMNASWTFKTFSTIEEIPEGLTYARDRHRLGWELVDGLWHCVNSWHQTRTTQQLVMGLGPLTAAVPNPPGTTTTTPSVPTNREW